MSFLEKSDEKKAEAILQQLKGKSIASAQELLDWCSQQLLEQPVGEWSLKPKD